MNNYYINDIALLLPGGIMIAAETKTEAFDLVNKLSDLRPGVADDFLFKNFTADKSDIALFVGKDLSIDNVLEYIEDEDGLGHIINTSDEDGPGQIVDTSDEID